MTKGLLIGKFMPFHKGHQLLIDFAANFVWETSIKAGWSTNHLDIIVGTMPDEPIDGSVRFHAVTNYADTLGMNIRTHHVDIDMPQSPDDDGYWERHPEKSKADFWNIWISAISLVTANKHYDYVFSSEPYGEMLAHHFNAVHIPVNLDRDVINISGTSCRQDMQRNWNNLNIEYRKLTQTIVTIAGAESVGKTTYINTLKDLLSVTAIPEYARGYLELKGPDNISEQTFTNLILGQIALFKSIEDQANKPVIVRDTDIFTTIGWYMTFFPNNPVPDWWWTAAYDYIADHYIVLDDNIPFTPDLLRYGDGVRQNDTSFWTNLFKQRGLSYTVVSDISCENRNKSIDFKIESIVVDKLVGKCYK